MGESQANYCGTETAEKNGETQNGCSHHNQVKIREGGPGNLTALFH
jgi:hypothetical protein